MKYAVVLCDGMADEPIKELGGKTPMFVAKKPCMNALAAKGEVGLAKTVAVGLKPGSDVANLSVMGYDPKKYYTGRSPLEAASIGIDLKDDDITLRCNLVTLSDEVKYEEKTIIDYCADDISTKEAKILIEYIEKELGTEQFKFYSGVSYRHCLVWAKGNPAGAGFTPPHDITGKKITNYIPKGNNIGGLYELMVKSYDLLKNHPVNLHRIATGKRPANSIWLWGEGKKPILDSFEGKFGVKGSVISAVDLLKGIGICAGMATPEVEGATGYIDTNFAGKLAAALAEFERGQDFVYIHIEAPDECGHRGEIQNKIKAIELIDEKILTPLIEALDKKDEPYSLLICPDHPTPLGIKTHTSNPVPYILYCSNSVKNSKVEIFDEDSAKNTGVYIEDGFTLINKLLNSSNS
ncbi:putative 2,3-bisphosphoglycerate-independent phosphoglycerate mutase [Clostridia bacterium]|nr:putative 2,3-bisphosphoglycerate-independent phosphoglycerate mutase [Clostridia bacterium]